MLKKENGIEKIYRETAERENAKRYGNNGYKGDELFELFEKYRSLFPEKVKEYDGIYTQKLTLFYQDTFAIIVRKNNESSYVYYTVEAYYIEDDASRQLDNYQLQNLITKLYPILHNNIFAKEKHINEIINRL